MWQRVSLLRADEVTLDEGGKIPIPTGLALVVISAERLVPSARVPHPLCQGSVRSKRLLQPLPPSNTTTSHRTLSLNICPVIFTEQQQRR